MGTAGGAGSSGAPAERTRGSARTRRPAAGRTRRTRLAAGSGCCTLLRMVGTGFDGHCLELRG